MNDDSRDDLDRVIDEALSSVMSGEPRRVSAASVRQALEPRRRLTLPLWLSVAAVLILGFVVSLRGPREAKDAPRIVLAPSPAASVSAGPSPLEEPSARIQRSSSERSRRTASKAVSDRADNAPEGLPRLTIASLGPPDPLDAPDPLLAARIEALALQIPRIEIAPLSVVTLSPEPERNPAPK